MKKILVSTFLFMVMVTFTNAQDFGQLRFGLKASPSFSWLNPGTTGFDRDGLKLGFSYGLIVDAPFSRSADFSTGIFINHLGGKLLFKHYHNEVLTDFSRNYSLSYLEIPLTLKMRTPEMGYFTYFGKFGLGLGFQIGASAKESFGSTIRDVDNFNKNTRFLNSSLIVGVGTEYAFGGRTALMVGITYNNGFMNVLKGKDYQDRDIKATLSYLEISLGILF
jgi:hypothetical protein